MRNYLFIVILCLALLIASLALAQDDESEFDTSSIPNFGRVLLEFEIPMEDNDFLLARHVAVQPDLSRIYVASGAAGIVLVMDEKGNVIDQVDVFYEGPVTDMAVGADGNLYVTQFGNLFAYDREGRAIEQIAGNFSEGIHLDQVAPAPDKTLYAIDVFSEKDRLYHYTAEGDDVLVAESGYLSDIVADDPSIFDQFRYGEDGLLYYFSDEARQMVQMDESFEVLNVYSNLITETTGTQRTAMLIDDAGRVLFGNMDVVEMYGAKEELIHTIKLDTQFVFVYDMTFADDGQLVILQGAKLTIVQYGERDDE